MAAGSLSFLSAGGGRAALWVCSADGSLLTRLVGRADGIQYKPAWSPDGQWIAFTEKSPSGEERIMVVGASGGTPRHVAPDQPGAQAWPSWSADGKSLYFRYDHDGFSEIVRTPVEGGPLTSVATVAMWAAESLDGKNIYYWQGGELGRDGGTLFSKPVTGGPEETVLDHIGWSLSVAKEGVYYFPASKRPIAGGNTLMFYDFATRRTREVLDIGKSGSSPSVSPDGKTILLTVTGAENSDLMLVENFR